jgi:transposase-like protein
VIYTTNIIEFVNMNLQKNIALALNDISRKWTHIVRDWKATPNRFTIQFKERMP